MRLATLPLALIALSGPTLAQNLLPEGDFEQGGQFWTLTAFNDPAGAAGFAAARTTGNGPSMAVYADFQTITSVRSATFRSTLFDLQPGPVSIGLASMWVKPTPAPIVSPTVNRVEFRIFDAANVLAFTSSIIAPATQGEIERRTFTGTFNVPAAGQYSVEIFLRHSNLAGIPFFHYVDDVYVGELDSFVFGQGCQGSGGAVPVLNSVGLSQLGSANYRLQLHDALAPSVALLMIGISDSNWLGIPLPLPLGGGCSLYTGPELTFSVPTAGAGPGVGTGEQAFPAIPNDPLLRRAPIFAQWLVVDAGGPAGLGFTTTAGLSFRIR
jgi:hypothetical protein